MRRMRMFAFLVVAAAMTTETAVADATWFCAIEGSPPSIVKYQVVGKELTNVTMAAFSKRVGIGNEWKYQILEDTPQGLVAILSQTKNNDDSASGSYPSRPRKMSLIGTQRFAVTANPAE